MRVLMDAHLRILRKLEKAGNDGIVASELIPDRVAREFVLKYLANKGLITRRRRFRGERVFITPKGLNLLRSEGNGIS
ncbi:MAG: hypothetical protein QI197_03870 [Candidatus Korarchaeota archaeon]|nr:hypothetical protein [Candidatus Korarchaeota archaeon]